MADELEHAEPAMPANASNLVGTTLGKYRLIEKIGQGGMAQVYKAYQAGLDRYVAVKILHPYLTGDEEFLARFRREARAIAFAPRLFNPLYISHSLTCRLFANRWLDFEQSPHVVSYKSVKRKGGGLYVKAKTNDVDLTAMVLERWRRMFVTIALAPRTLSLPRALVSEVKLEMPCFLARKKAGFGQMDWISN